MRTILTMLCLLVCWGTMPMLHAAQDPTMESRYLTYEGEFDAAYRQYPNIPRGLLEAVSWTNTRMTNRSIATSAPSCAGIPQVQGIMGLMEDGAGWFRENAAFIAKFTHTNRAAMRDDAGVQVLAYARALDAFARASGGDLHSTGTWLDAVSALSEIPAQQGEVNNYALQSQLYSVATFMMDASAQRACQFPSHSFDLAAYFGAGNLRVLSATTVTIDGEEVRAGQTPFEPLPAKVTSADYTPAIWNAAATCNYSSRAGTAVSAVTIHTTQGSYSGAISWFQNCASSVSAHYVLRSSDGQVTQMVLESDKAWHVGSENPYTIGLEHEGFVDDAAWYTNALYTSAAALVSDIAASGYGINKLRTYFGPPTAGTNLLSVNCYKIKGHQHFPNQTHVDPGLHWDWERFYQLVNGAATTTTYTTATGTLYDAGGSAANYGNDQRQAWRIAPTGATTVTLTFSAFNCEANYDYLHIYDGNDNKGQLIGKYTGTTLPPVVVAKSGKVYLEFRSDCATTAAGWAASWTRSTAVPTCGFPASLTTTPITAFSGKFNWGATTGAIGYEVRYRHSLTSTWTTVTTTANTYTATGLKSNSDYYWQVRTKCSATVFSSWAGTSFQTPAAATASTTLCSGTFRDSGGNIANYRNSESYTYTIAPTGATGVTITFSSFDIESGYDYLYIYNGPSTASPLIGTYTGTTSPGTKTATSGTMTLRFVSDSWTTKPGWNATWSCATTLNPVTANSEPEALGWSVAPNPFAESLHLQLEGSGMHHIRLYDLQGRILMAQELEGGRGHELATAMLPAGSYLLQVTNPEGVQNHRRVVRQ